MPEPGGASKFELATVVQGLRQELAAAVQQAKDEALRFELQELELELQVQVTREYDGRVGFKFWVLEAGMGTKGADTSVQTVRLKMKPAGKDGELPKLGRTGG